MNIYIGNLSYQTTDEELRAAFAVYGEVSSATVIKDKFTGEAKGFGFVEMPKQSEAEMAIKKLNGTELKGRTITVNQAKPRKESDRGGRRRF
ncbi:MAG TPA: RNA-binding protein [Candidatus Competibacteraceae bacterium]|nr:RNA-binding protein [Candidatus Competibacteraceae bacterium]